MGLDAGMQQPTACLKYEGDRVRCVAPKLIANGEPHALRSREAAQLGASGLGSHVVVKRAGVERREAYWLAAARARLRKGTRKNHSHERDKGRRCVLPECQQGTMEEST